MRRSPLLYVAIALVAKIVLARWLALGVRPALSIGLLPDAALVVLLACLVALLPARWRWPAWLALDAAASVVLVGVVVYTGFFGRVPAFVALQLLPQLLPLVRNVAALLRPVYLLFALDLPVLAWLAWSSPPMAEGGRSRAAVTAALLAAAVALATTVALVDQLPSDTAAAASRGLFPTQLARALASLRAPALGVDPTDRRAVQARVDVLRPQPGISPYAGIAKGRNLIVVQVESLQAFPIGRKVAGRPIAPTLDALSHEGFWFPDFFTQVGHGHTADAELSANTSLYPMRDAVVGLSYADKRLPSLPRLLDAAGYDTMTFHANRLAYWNRGAFYPALGYGRAYADEFFGRSDSIGLAASDDVLFAKTAELLAARQPSERPFFADLVTLSAHDPASIAEDRVPLKVPERFKDSGVGWFLRGVSYEDAALGRFVEALKRSGVWERSVIVIYGDHGILPPTDDPAEAGLRAEVLGRPYTEADYLNVPLLVLVPGAQAPGPVAPTAVPAGVTLYTTGGQVDILPTVTALLGIPADGQVRFGRDLLAPGPSFLGMIPAGAAGAYADDDYLVVPEGGPSDAVAYEVRSKERASSPSARVVRDGMARATTLEGLSDALITALPAR